MDNVAVASIGLTFNYPLPTVKQPEKTAAGK